MLIDAESQIGILTRCIRLDRLLTLFHAWRKRPMQPLLFDQERCCRVYPFKAQLLKWIGNKQRFAHEIASYFPQEIGTYFEPFLGGGGVLGTLAPARGVASDA